MTTALAQQTPPVAPAALRPNLFDRMFLNSYRHTLWRELRALTGRDAERLHALVEAESERLCEASRELVVDRAAMSHLLLCARVLATYRVLQAEGHGAEAFAITERCFLSTGKKTPKFLMRLFPLLVRDPFRAMVRISKTKQLAYYGKSFDHAIERDDDGAFLFTVKRCFYVRFFAAQGAPELAPIFCAKDNDWADGIEPDRMGFTFTRPTTLARGGDCCRFQFVRLGVQGRG